MNNRIAYSYRASKNARLGFTLIEILAVIAIIGLIAAATLVALGGARGFFSNVTAKARLDDVAQCLEMYKQKFGEYPPDCAMGCEDEEPTEAEINAKKAEIRRHILKRWPRTLKAGVVDDMVNMAYDITVVDKSAPGGALLFWLAGAPDPEGSQVAYEGFLSDEENPFGIGISDIDGEPRETPMIELTFDSDGTQGGNYNKDGLIFRGQPIVYFRSGYAGKDKHVGEYGVAAPYMKDGKWYNADSFQLILPGEDANFGDHSGEEHEEEARDVTKPSTVSNHDWDNVANFTNGATLETERE